MRIEKEPNGKIAVRFESEDGKSGHGCIYDSWEDLIFSVLHGLVYFLAPIFFYVVVMVALLKYIGVF